MIVREFDRPRVMGEFAISDSLRQALARLRQAENVLALPSVDADQLHAVEVAVSYRFANDLLAVYAAKLPLLSSRHQWELDRVVAHTGKLATLKARGDFVGLGVDDGHALALSLRAPEVDTTILYRVDLETGSGERWQSLESFIVTLAAAAPESPTLDFRPLLERAPPGGSSGKRVRHPTFGEGRVFLEIGSGAEKKLKVDFPKVGLKTLLARFVEYIDD
jgi:hypothetical protein